MKIDEIRAVLDKYQQGTCTEEERKAIEAWYDSLRLGEKNPLRQQELDASLARIRDGLRKLPGQEGEAVGEHEAPGREVGEHEVPGRTVGEHGVPGRAAAGKAAPVRVMANWRGGVAAAVLIVIAASLWWLRTLHPKAGAGPVLQDSMNTVVTARGETRRIILPDGSTLQLNAGTAFRYPKHFAGATRTVELLKGEVYLQVVAQPEHPFIVRTGRLRTKVLGTSFDIRAYEEEKRVRIGVLTGKVCVDEEGKSLAVLEKGMSLEADRGVDSIARSSFENDYEMAAWKEGAMYFRDAGFGDIAFEIANKYDIGLVNKSKKKLWSYTGLFRNESLEEVIETICQTESLRYTFDNNEILIIDK
jgi:ferric-dicitrate binding protein FerR (iron transport regulator)